MGRSPQDIDDQISYPMTVALLGIPGVKDIRSYSVFGFSTIYVVFEGRHRVLLVALGVCLKNSTRFLLETLPSGVVPTLGPDATALGQVFWYTLEGRDPDGKPDGRMGAR